MNITAINGLNHYNTNFRGHFVYDDEFGVEIPVDSEDFFEDDPQNQAIRNALRSQLYQYSGINYHESNKYAKDLGDSNISNLQHLRRNSYRGASLITDIKNLDLLEHSGVNTVIDLAGFKSLKDECERRNLHYIEYVIDKTFWANPIFKNTAILAQEEYQRNQIFKDLGYAVSDNSAEYMESINIQNRKFMNEFIDLVDCINKGNYYIGCELGDYRTSNILYLISNLDPQWHDNIVEQQDPTLSTALKNMYDNMTDDEKQRLGFTHEFEKDLQARLRKN